MAELRVGTSGWIYKHWAKDFYPERVRAREHLLHYSTLFDSVEINGSFYRLPTLAGARGWYRAVPDDFVFAVKGSRFITHMKKLKVTKQSIAIFFRRIAPLKQKTGPILWQLPPQLRRDPERLDAFLALLPRRFRYAVEFRDPSWYEDDEALDVLARHNVAHCSASSLRMPERREVTADFAYFRFHGLAGGFAHDYTNAELLPWARLAVACLNDGVDVFAYFNNDENVRAPRNAVAFRAMIHEARVLLPSGGPGPRGVSRPGAPGRSRPARPSPPRKRARRRAASA